MAPQKPFFISIKFVLALILAFWLVHILSLFFPLQRFGLIPRTPMGLIGIITAPFLHANFYHLYANTLGLLIFGVLFAFLEKKNTASLIVEIIFFQGILLWALGRNGNHIGASGLIFGLFGYLLFIGYFKREIKYMLISLCVLFFYGGTLTGILPTHPGISWDGHLTGFLVGCAAARYRK